MLAYSSDSFTKLQPAGTLHWGLVSGVYTGLKHALNVIVAGLSQVPLSAMMVSSWKRAGFHMLLLQGRSTGAAAPKMPGAI